MLNLQRVNGELISDISCLGIKFDGLSGGQPAINGASQNYGQYELQVFPKKMNLFFSRGLESSKFCGIPLCSITSGLFYNK